MLFASSPVGRPLCRLLLAGVSVSSLVALPAAAPAADAAARDWSGVELAWRDDPRAPADAPPGVDAPPTRWPTRRAQRRAVASRRRGGAEVADVEQPSAHGPVVQPVPSAFDDGFRPSRPPVGAAGMPLAPQGMQPGFCPVPGPITGVMAGAGAAAVSDPFAGSIDAAPRTMPLSPEVVTEAPSGPFQAASVRSPTTGGAIVSHRDQPYAVAADGATPGQSPHARHRFDLHRHAGCSAGGMPLVVWIHGDSWREGSKADCPIVWLADEGYVVASIGYRLSDAAVFPAQLDDCRAAIEQIVRDADVWGIDPARVAVVGSGGGGHLAALVGLVREPAAAPAGRAADAVAAVPRVAAVCAVATPANLTTLGPEHDRAGSFASRLVGGPLPEFREKAQRASPMSHVSADDPPVLIVHGAADAVVTPRQAAEFDLALKATGVDSTLVMLPGVGHKPALGRGTPAGQSLLMFLDRTLGAGVRIDPVAAESAAPEASSP